MRAQQQKDPDLAYNAASYAAELLHRRGDLRQAEVLAGQTAVTAREFGDRSIESLMWLRLCIARTDLNKLHLARDACTAAAKAAEPDPALASYASDSWARLANLFFRGGQAEEALGAMDRAVETATRGPVQFARHTRQVDAAELFNSLGQFESAELASREALAAAAKAGLKTVQVDALSAIARARLGRGDYAGSQTDLEQAQAIAIAEGNRLQQQRIQAQMGLAALEARRLPEARKTLTTAIAQAKNSEDLLLLPSLLMGLGHVDLTAGDHGSARRNFLQAQGLATAGNRADIMWESAFGLGWVAEKSGDAEDALRHYRQALDRSEQQRASLADPAWRAPFFATRQDVYRRTVALLAAQHRPHEAFAVLERGRARTLLDLTVAAPSEEPEPRERELATVLSNAERRLLDATLANAPDAALLKRLHGEAEIADSDHRLYRSRVVRRRFAALASEQPVDVSLLQARLGADSVYLCFAWGAEKGLAFVVTSKTLHTYEIGNTVELAREVAAARALLAAPPRRVTVMSLNQQLHRLYRTLLGPAEAHLRGKRRWIVSAEGPLQGLPFAALLEREHRDASFATAPFVIRRASILMVPSATSFLKLAERQRDRTGPFSAVVFADSLAGPQRAVALGPLPAARREAQGIARVYGLARTEVRLGDEATEPAARALLPKARVGHFAVHGYADPRRPQSSALLLSPVGTGQGNGLLQAYEIQALPLQLDVAVLSACKTLVGRDLPGEGIEALAHSFLLAGTSTVIGSQWSVADVSTADLMIRVHHGLRTGRLPSQALREGQLATLSQPAFAHPYYWAAFQAIGADAAIGVR